MAHLNSAWDDLEKAESEREEALRAELKRQQLIASLLEQFRLKAKLLNTWNAEKESYLSTKEVIDTVSTAVSALKLLSAYEGEFKDSAARVAQLHELGISLSSALHNSYSFFLIRATNYRPQGSRDRGGAIHHGSYRCQTR